MTRPAFMTAGAGLCLALLLLGCAERPDPEAYIEKKQDAYVSRLEADGETVAKSVKHLFDTVASLEAREDVSCAESSWITAEQAAKSIERLAFYRYHRTGSDEPLAHLFKDNNREVGEKFARRAVEGRIMLANVAVEHDCDRFARQQYRHVIDTYGREEYQQYRALAEAGLNGLGNR